MRSTTALLPSYLQKQAYQYKLDKAKAQPLAADYYWRSLQILDKDDRLIPLRLNPVQLDYQQHRGTRNLVLKARQQGVSTFIQADHFVTAITQTTRVATLAHDDKTTQKLRGMASTYWANLPRRPARGLDNATTTTYPETGSEVSIMTAGSANIGRGGTYTRFHGSEVAFWKDAQSIMKGVLQGVPEQGIIDLESTPNGAQGWFYERCMESLDGDGYWSLFFFPWWLTPEYRQALVASDEVQLEPDETELVALHGLTLEQIKWRRYKQKELGKRDFQQEYPEDPHSCFLTSGDSYFGDIDLALVLSAPTAPEPSPQRRIVGGLDFGQANDYTVLSLADADTFEEVKLHRVNRKSWGDMRAEVVSLCKKWNVLDLHPEKNSMGGTNIEELQKELRAAGAPTRLHPFDTTPASKPPLITGFHYALGEAGLKLLPDAVGRQELLTFTATQTPSGAWRYEAKQGHDDTVIARALMWYAIAGGGHLVFSRAPDNLNSWRG